MLEVFLLTMDTQSHWELMIFFIMAGLGITVLEQIFVLVNFHPMEIP